MGAGREDDVNKIVDGAVAVLSRNGAWVLRIRRWDRGR